MPEHSLAMWLLLVLVALLVGMAKTGVPGLGILVVPLVGHAIPDGRLAPAVLLPLLCAADVMGVALYRRHADHARLWGLFPWVALGMAGGTLALDLLSGAVLRTVTGVVVLVMAALHLGRERVVHLMPPGDRRSAILFGCVAGFATTVAHAAGPVMNLYLLGMGLPKDQFMGTGTWFFLIINLVKVPIYAAQGMFTASGLWTAGVLLPVVGVGAWCGRRVYAHLPEVGFQRVVLTLVIVSGLALLLPRPG